MRIPSLQPVPQTYAAVRILIAHARQEIEMRPTVDPSVKTEISLV